MSAHAQESRSLTGAPAVSITSFSEADHDRQEEILVEVGRMFADGEVERAEDMFREFRELLQHHLNLEEELLFPLFEERTGVLHGPTEVMRREHRKIATEMETVRSALDRNDATAFREGYDELLEILPLHHAKEERVLYPMLDRKLTDEERADFVARLHALR